MERKEDGDGLWMEVDIGGSSPLDKLERCVTMYIPGSILTLTTGGISKVEAMEWGGVRIFVNTFMEEFGSLYTLYLPTHSSHIEDPLLATLGFSRMVNDNKEVAIS